MTAARGASLVEARIRRLDGDALVAFVADLWAARGYETGRDGDAVVATRDGRRVRIVVRPRSRLPLSSPANVDQSTDVVVAPDGIDAKNVPDGGRVVDASELRAMLWYALDRDRRRELCARHFGGPPDSLSRRWPARFADRLRAVGGRLSPGPLAVRGRFAVAVPAVVVVFVVLAASVVVFGSGAIPGVPIASDVASAPLPSAGSASTPAPTPTAMPVPTANGAPAAGGVTATSSSGLPPGVGPEGITNLTALAVAHDRGLANRSYAVWLDRYRPRSEGSRIQLDVDITLADGRYLVESSLGDDANRRTIRGVYYDGTDWYVANRSGVAPAYRRVPGTGESPLAVPGPLELRRSLVTTYLSTPWTNVSGPIEKEGRQFYRITGQGVPTGPGFESLDGFYEVMALVDRRGVVHHLEVIYEDTTMPGSPLVSFEVTYGRFGQVTVRPPAWYERQFGSGSPGQSTRRENESTRTPNGSPLP